MSADVFHFEGISLRRHAPEHNATFLALSSELSKVQPARHHFQEWQKLLGYCRRIFQQHGYDLMTGAWYCYLSAGLTGWNGLAAALEQYARASKTLNGSEADASLHWLDKHLGEAIFLLPAVSGHRVAMMRTQRALLEITGRVQRADHPPLLNGLCQYLAVRMEQEVTTARMTEWSSKSAIIKELPTVSEACEQSQEEISTHKPVEPAARHRFALLVIGVLSLLFIIVVSLTYLFPGQPASEKFFTQLEQTVRDGNLKALTPEEMKHQFPDEKLKWLLHERPGLLLYLPQLRPLVRGMLEENSVHEDKFYYWNDIQTRLQGLEENLLASEVGKRKHLTISELKTEVYQLKEALRKLDKPLEIYSQELHMLVDNKNEQQALFSSKVNDVLREHYRL